MSIYIIIYIFLSIFVLLEEKVKQNQRICLFLINAFIIVFFQSFRWRTGTDWSPYHDFFISSNYKSHVNNSDFELGYTYLNQFIRKFSSSYTIFLFIECTLNIFFIYLFANHMKINKCLILLISFSLAVFPIRYTLASNIILCSYKYIIERKKILFFLMCLIAFSIHRSVIVFFPMYFIVRKEYSIRAILLILLFAIVLGLSGETFFGDLVRLISIFYSHVGDAFQNKLSAYVTEEIPEYGELSGARLIISFLNSLVFIFIFYYFKQKRFKNNLTYNVLFNLYIIGIVFNRLFWQIIPDFARVTSLFAGGFPILIYMIFSSYNSKIKFIGCILMCIYYYIKYQTSSFGGFYSDLFIPYYSIFSNGSRFFVY